MSAKPLLVLDCWMEAGGGLRSFRPFLADVSVRSIALPHVQTLPQTCGDVRGVLISGSAASVTDNSAWVQQGLTLVRDALDRNLPMLGVCFGHQLIGEAVGGQGTVSQMRAAEVGFRDVTLRRGDPLFDALPARFSTFMSHGDEVHPRPGLEIWGHSTACPIQALRVSGRPAWGVQFHTEYDRQTQWDLLELRQTRHPELAIDPQAEMKHPPNTPRQAHALFGRFLELCV